VEQAIEYAMEAGAFEHAFDISRVFLQNKLPEVIISISGGLGPYFKINC
jgi:hypothetical protein